MQRFSRRAALLAAVLAGGLGTASGPAAAQSPICQDLQAQYLALSRTTGVAANPGQRMVQMDMLSRELASAQAAARQGNCNRFLFFGPRPSPQCPAILGTIERLRQQLAQARQGRNLVALSPDWERQRLRDWMQSNGCEVPETGVQRTICVRACDGYYFPISFSASRQNFAKDSAACQSMYSADGQAELFHYTTNRDIGEARSLSGQRYGDQPYAFLFRQGFFASCQGQLKDGMSALANRYWMAQPQRAADTPARVADARAALPMPMPTLRPTERQEDPETVANRAGNLAVAPWLPEDAEATTAVAGRGGIRLVGAAYYAELFDPTAPPLEQPVHRGPLGFDLIGAAMAAELESAVADSAATVTSELR